VIQWVVTSTRANVHTCVNDSTLCKVITHHAQVNTHWHCRR